MLHLLYGPAASGKTDLLMGRIRAAVAARTPGQVLLVPEQYSHEAERALCAFLCPYSIRSPDPENICAAFAAARKAAQTQSPACGTGRKPYSQAKSFPSQLKQTDPLRFLRYLCGR